MSIQDDFGIATNGDIRYTGGATNYTVIALHRWLGDLMDDAAAVGNDVLDITDATASERSTDNIITLKPPYNIDDTAAQHLYDGSIIQDNGNVIYDGLVVIAAAGMYLSVIQNGGLATNFWTTGLNADPANGISHRFMLKVRTAGADLDGRRLIGTTREFGFTYSEFKINGTSRGNNVMALTYASDLNNQTVEATVAGWTTIINTEGYRLIDVNGDTATEPYFSEWDRDTFTINQFYERMKWLTRRGSGSTVYGQNGALFRGITHQIAVDTPTGTFSASENISWSGGTGRMVAINSPTAATLLWIQLLTGVAPTDNQTLTGVTSLATCLVNATVTERSLSFPWCGQSTGSAIIAAYGFGLQAADLTANDRLFDLTNTQRTPPNNVSFSVGGLVSTEDRVLVTRLAYAFAYDTESGGPFTDGETLTFLGGETAKLLELVDNVTTGYMTIRLISGSVPVDNDTLTGGTSLATATVNGSVSPTVDTEQYTLNGALIGAAVTSVVVTEAIDSDTPQSTTVRIKRASGIYTVHPVTSWSGSTFTITSANFSVDTAPNGTGVYSSFIDKVAAAASESFTVVYNSNRNLFIRVRDGGGSPIKTFETTGTLTGAGGSTTAIRTSDT